MHKLQKYLGGGEKIMESGKRTDFIRFSKPEEILFIKNLVTQAYEINAGTMTEAELSIWTDMQDVNV
jgi:hypothetical protein